MTIKQQGGIFGRKPTFSKVDVEGSDASSFDRTGSLGKIVTFNDDGSEVGAIGTNGNVWFQGPSGTAGVEFANGMILPWRDGARANGSIALGSSSYKFNGGHFSNNLVMDSGNGIDFSATSGTGTSELFSDYEEGTWVPVLTDFTNNSPTSARGAYYTKVGNIVFASCNFINVDTTGMTSGAELYLDGFPYTSKSTTGTNYFVAGGVQYSGTSVTNQPIPSLVDGTDYMRFFDSGTFWSVSNLTDDAADLYINVVYLAA